MKVIETIQGLRAECDAARSHDLAVGFVPTMGSFHAGHRSLMAAARAETDFVVVSLFVNPTQFGPTEDLSAYPRDDDGDAETTRELGVDVLFRPSVAAMYPTGVSHTIVHVAGLTTGMCGAARPTHFDGVCTVVAKLFSIVGPARAYFGRKDFQQLAVVQRMAADLDLPVSVVGCPLVREPDGLAMSSRNAYLSPTERACAPVLHAALLSAADLIAAGERRPAVVVAEIGAMVAMQPTVALEYVEVRDAQLLQSFDGPGAELHGSFVVAVAARLGRTRLIDNVVVTISGTAVTVDAGVQATTDRPPTATFP